MSTAWRAPCAPCRHTPKRHRSLRDARGKGKSAVAASAYRSGEKIKNEYDGVVHDFTRKGGIAHTEILLPQNAPQEFANRSVLWNSVEKIEKSKNSQLAREIEIALPKKLDREKQIELVREYVKENFVKVGMCADIALHDKRARLKSARMPESRL